MRDSVAPRPTSGARTEPGALSTTTRPVERYGAPHPWARLLAIGVASVLAIAGIGWLTWAGLYHSQPSVSARLRAFTVLDGQTVSATIDVEREPGQAATCLLEAQAADHFVVGERQVTIPAGPREALRLTYRIQTERPATNAVLDGCTPQG